METQQVQPVERDFSDFGGSLWLINLINESLASLEWNQSDLARKSGVIQSNLNAFLKGKRGISEEMRDRVLFALDAALLNQKHALDAKRERVKGLLEEARLRTQWVMENIQRRNGVN